MFGNSSNSKIRPVALGATVLSSTYGQTIPTCFGRTKGALYLIWAANMRKYGTDPNTNQQAYAENVDFLIGTNPIAGVLQCWQNSTRLPLIFGSWSANITTSTGSVTVPDPNFYSILGVTLETPYTENFSDYGSPPGSATTNSSFTATVTTWAMINGVATQRKNGNATYAYVVVALDSTGAMVGSPSNIAITNQGSSVLSRNSYNAITWPAVVGAASYQVFRVQGWLTGIIAPATQYTSLTGHSTLTDTFLNDTGYVPDATPTLPSGGASIFELPLWNAAYAGPDPVNGSSDRYAPYFYIWQPGSGATLNFPQNFGGTLGLAGSLKVYYAAVNPNAVAQNGKTVAAHVPIHALRMTFEPQLGDGLEYQGNDSSSGAVLANQRILYPHYAGLGSPNLDLGSSQALPDIQVEILGTYPLYHTGDCDFADMVEDIFRMGISQAGFASAWDTTEVLNVFGLDFTFSVNLAEDGSIPAYSPVQRHLGAFEWPGSMQCITMGDTGTAVPAAIAYNRNNTQGNPLVVVTHVGSASVGSAPAISDTAADTWTALFPTSTNANAAQLWRSTASASGANSVTVTPEGTGWQTTILEIAGVDTYDTSATDTTGSATSLSVTTSNAAGTPGYVLGFAAYEAGTAPSSPNTILWKNVVTGDTPPADYVLQCRTVYSPGTVTWTPPTSLVEALPTQIGLIAFKCSQPPNYPRPLGDILDQESLDLCRTQCRANGLWGSLLMDSQQAASDWLQDIFEAMNAAPVWSGFKLKSIPYSEVSTAGNGAVYSAPTASGPLADLGPADFIGDENSPLVSIERKAQVDVPNLLQIQHPNRDSDYNDVVVCQPETAAIAIYGPRKEDPQQMRCIQDTTVARMVLAVQVRRQNYLRNTYKFKLKAQHKLFEPMDLVTLTDPLIGLSKAPVRFTKIEEDDQFQLDCEAEPFIYGVHAPDVNFLVSTATAPYGGVAANLPGNVNTPIIFEPVSQLSSNVQQLWLAVSGASVNYGGCLVYMSTDGGNSYNQVGVINGSAITGVTTADWPAATDPDTTNNLAVDLTESRGALGSFQVADEDAFTYPCYVAGGSSSIPYELMTYAVATLTATNKYTLQATGTGNKLRRSVFGAPSSSGAGVDHPSGSRFAFLGTPSSVSQDGILKLAWNANWAGQTLWFKFLSFNTIGNSIQQLANATAYSYTPTGTPGVSQLFLVNGG